MKRATTVVQPGMTSHPPHLLRVASPPARPTMIYDGDCGFCIRQVHRMRAVTGDAIEYVSSQQLEGRFAEIPRRAFDEAVQLVETDGSVRAGAEAIVRALELSGRKRAGSWMYRHLPVLATTADLTYRFVSAHRGGADKVDRLLLEDPTDLRRSHVATRTLFLRGIGVVYLIAFLSIWVQIDGLVGSGGIMPARMSLSAARVESSGASALRRFVQLPTLCWINDSDRFLQFLCGGGALLSVLLVLGIAPAFLLLLLWLFYLSLVNVSHPFLPFQWDGLLLEAGFLSIFIAPLQLRLRSPLFLNWMFKRSIVADSPPSRLMLFLLRWLLFRVMFLSGLVKFFRGDPTWTGLTALRYHYWTQPLPTWTSWYANLAPNWFQSISTAGVFLMEVFVPLLFFAPRRLRLFACTMTVLLQLLIAATGNYGFFNLLTIVLCIVLLDDAALARLRLGPPGECNDPIIPARGLRWPWWVTAPLVGAIVPLSWVPSLYRLDKLERVPRWLLHAYVEIAPFGSINPYGLFEQMTTDRPELIVQGSDDGIHWQAYEFKWKPGEVKRRPAFCTPHMPRLDWQMWFAALDIYHQNRGDVWLWNFMDRLREGSPAVLKLLDRNPFPDHPPRYVRLMVYEYRFTTRAQKSASGAWWHRDPAGIGPTIGPDQETPPR